MKPFLSTILFLGIFTQNYAQNTFPSTGYTGIGTTNPTAILHVTGTIDLPRSRFEGQSSGVGGVVVDFATFNGTEPSPVGSILGTNYAFNYGTYMPNQLNIAAPRSGGVGIRSSMGPINFYSGNADGDYSPIRMTINNLGNVGIGTTIPTAMLTVAGNIHTRGVKVNITAGADFVFATDYQLPSLKLTEKYIIANKHLPGIPSAKEMTINGVDLGEINIKLLQKIEELTLHLIKLDKEIEEQSIIIRKLSSANR